MKRLLVVVFLAFLMFHGISFLVFVLRMMWHSPDMMGMMMGRQMMYDHLFYWFCQTFWLSLFLAGVIILIWAIYEYRKNKKN